MRGKCYVTSLHTHDLCQWQSTGQHLVVVYKVNINQASKSMSNPYAFNIGIEALPSKLGDIIQGGLYPWDLNQMMRSPDSSN